MNTQTAAQAKKHKLSWIFRLIICLLVPIVLVVWQYRTANPSDDFNTLEQLVAWTNAHLRQTDKAVQERNLIMAEDLKRQCLLTLRHNLLLREDTVPLQWHLKVKLVTPTHVYCEKEYGRVWLDLDSSTDYGPTDAHTGKPLSYDTVVMEHSTDFLLPLSIGEIEEGKNIRIEEARQLRRGDTLRLSLEVKDIKISYGAKEMEGFATPTTSEHKIHIKIVPYVAHL